MNFIVREAKASDLSDLMGLAKQFSLLNLPADTQRLEKKLKISKESFSKNIIKEKAAYLFVLEDLETKKVIGCSQIKAKHGTQENPTYSFKISKKELFSKSLGIGFLHQFLTLKVCTDGPTEIGGLVVEQSYRRRPEKVGKLISLSRFMYLAMESQLFSKTIHSEMAPPLTKEGKSAFWEALGRRFTGMPYQEADEVSQINKEFINDLFPKGDLHLCLLDASARLVMGQVSSETKGALRMLESQGFTFNDEVDPFDGGPHLNVILEDIKIIKQSKTYKFSDAPCAEYDKKGLLAVNNKNQFLCGSAAYGVSGDTIYLPGKVSSLLEIKTGDMVLVSEDK